MNLRAALVVSLTFLMAGVAAGQESFQYRDFRLGSGLAEIVKQTGTTPAAVRVVHQRPAAIAELEWRPRYYGGGVAALSDPVGVMLFRFYDDRLFMIVVDYDAQRTDGMSASDMIAAISETYGPVTRVLSKPAPTLDGRFGLPDTPLGVWTGTDYSLTLSRVTYPAAFRLVVAHTPLEKLARTAIDAAGRLDADEAPAREQARVKKAEDDAQAAREKAKADNSSRFRP